MSGNPFRRSQAVDLSSEQAILNSTQAARLFSSQKQSIENDTLPQAQVTPSARSLFPDSSDLSRSPFPPEPIAGGGDYGFAKSENETPEDLSRSNRALPTATTMRAPFNPFAKKHGAPSADSNQVRPMMDVDTFKDILLGGSKPPPPPLPQQNGRPYVDLDPPYDSPKSSLDNYRPEFDDIDGYENEDSSLMGPLSSRPQEVAPQAPPKPKTHKGPQTVSFAEFDESIPPDFLSAGPKPPSLRKQSSGILRPSLQRSSSDLNKPLPPPPELSFPRLETLPSEPTGVQAIEGSDLNITSLNDGSSVKKTPPPPPAARRQAGTGGLGRPRSSSNLTHESGLSTPDLESNFAQFPVSSSAETASIDSKSSMPPPAPPSRKQATAVSSPQPHTSLQTPESPASSTSSKPIPPPPPRRNASRSGDSSTGSLHELTGGSSRPSPSSQHSVLNLTAPSSTAPPPPPPPRRAAATSKRLSSIDSAVASPPQAPSRHTRGRRPSSSQASENNSERSASVAGSSLHLDSVTEPDDEEGLTGNNKATNPVPLSDGHNASRADILADMSAFQAEIDALRRQAGGVR